MKREPDIDPKLASDALIVPGLSSGRYWRRRILGALAIAKGARISPARAKLPQSRAADYGVDWQSAEELYWQKKSIVKLRISLAALALVSTAENRGLMPNDLTQEKTAERKQIASAPQRCRFVITFAYALAKAGRC